MSKRAVEFFNDAKGFGFITEEGSNTAHQLAQNFRDLISKISAIFYICEFWKVYCFIIHIDAAYRTDENSVLFSLFYII